MSDGGVPNTQSQDSCLDLKDSQTEKMPDPIGYFVPKSRIDEQNTFTGGVLVPVGWSSGNLYDRLCGYFKKANIKKIPDVEDMNQKADNAVRKITSKEITKIRDEGTQLEKDVLSRLEDKKFWTLQELDEWLEKIEKKEDGQPIQKGNSLQEKEQKNKQPQSVQMPPSTGVEENQQPNGTKDLTNYAGPSKVKNQIIDDLRLGNREEVEFLVGEGQLTVSLYVGEKAYVLNDSLLNECVTELDTEAGGGSLTKHELAKFGLRLLPSFIQENKSLSEQLKKKEEEVVQLQKEFFNANTRELLLKQEVEALKRERVEKQETQQSTGMINKVMIKLEEIQKENKAFREENKEFRGEAKADSLVMKQNTDRAVEILGGLKKNTDKALDLLAGLKKERTQPSCKVKVTQELEETQKTITFYGSKASLQYLEKTQGELHRDLETLKRKRMVLLETTEVAGVENILPLLMKADEKRSVALIVLNVGAETAELFLDDQEYGKNAATQLKIAAKKLAANAKENFDRVIFVIPPHTAQSYAFIEKIAETLKEEDGFEILSISKVQIEMAQGKEDDQTWKLDKGRSLKVFSITNDEAKEGWNYFSSNVMITEVASLLTGTKMDCCGDCGLGHIRSVHCQKETEIREEVKMENRSASGHSSSSRQGSYSQEFSEECLNCFRTHDGKSCTVPENIICNYPGCFRKGHLKIIHFPRKKDTVDRLLAKYKESFSFVNPDGPRKREGNRDSSRDIKRARDDRDKSR